MTPPPPDETEPISPGGDTPPLPAGLDPPSDEGSTVIRAPDTWGETLAVPGLPPPERPSSIGAPAPPSDAARLRPAAAAATPESVAGYRILRPIASGGMGTVYEAEQQKPKRVVALKVVKQGVATPHLLRRFEFEAEVLGQLDHPGVARIFEAGMFDAGSGPQPFFAMEYVRGLPLNKWAEERKLTIRQKLELMAKVCDAVEHAHQKGIIHRDLKPGNILVVDDGSPSGQPKVLDFGLARMSAEVQTVSLHTATGEIIGTLLYMSPEQAEGRAEKVDTRSDVYALGVIAYELLAGRHPIDVKGKLIFEILRSIREDDVSPISSANRIFRGDIETILGKSLAKEKDRRYATATDLAEDIRSYLADEPIAARPPGTAYQVMKFARRNHALVAGLAATFLALVLGLSATLWQASKVTRLNERLNASKQEAEFFRGLAEKSERELEVANQELELLSRAMEGTAALTPARTPEQGYPIPTPPPAATPPAAPPKSTLLPAGGAISMQEAGRALSAALPRQGGGYGGDYGRLLAPILALYAPGGSPGTPSYAQAAAVSKLVKYFEEPRRAANVARDYNSGAKWIRVTNGQELGGGKFRFEIAVPGATASYEFEFARIDGKIRVLGDR